MRQILFAAMIALAVSISVTPVLIRVFTRVKLGQEIRAEGPRSHQVKRGTPTMGGIAIVAGMWAGYLGSHVIGLRFHAPGMTASGLLVLGLATALGVVGFLDDFIKLYKRRNLGLTARGKYVGQFGAAIIFGILALRFPDSQGLTPGSRHFSIVRDLGWLSFIPVLFLVLVCFLVVAWSNAVNITDGLDGLAAGSMGMTLGAYVLITFWQYTNSCVARPHAGCYQVRDPLDLALVCASAGAACVGFLWWNAAPAKIFMGDTGALALGGLLAGLSITSRTELLMVLVGALFCAEIFSVLLQIIVFRTTGRRLFRMAPVHHHFELGRWPETMVTTRFWLVAAISAAAGLMAFYGEDLAVIG
ncbi:phospho-N-acetylmuramoyl-pentapeptide-transferase [Nocardia sp. NPDC020380]|uniref:phospho-N-acetylmuramoyl-pentapeptide- transferase n=1 Tax=Nocardia sp. NPDC020380 TaxID=3364309 RepID=UPI0037BBB83F